MAPSQSAQNIKRARKESHFFKTISRIFLQLAQDDPQLQEIIINRIVLSPSYGTCTVFIYLPGEQKGFDEKLQLLKLYKPSIRKAISELIPRRYTPDIIFKYDRQYEKQRQIEKLLETLAQEDKL